MKTLKYMAGVALATMAISSCDEDTLTVGQSLTGQTDQLELVTANFAATSQTTIADSVLSLSNKCYFGKVKDPETGTDVTSEFTTQFHVVENIYVAKRDSIATKWEGDVAADSCDLILYLSSPFSSKDSLTAMKMRLRELSKPIEEGQFYYSNYDPVAHNMIRKDDGAIDQGKMFTYLNLNDPKTTRDSSQYLNNIRIPLNAAYQDKDGKKYNNYGTYILRKYFEKPSSFRNSYTFAHEVCPGFFFEIADGLGFHANVSNIGLRVFYRLKTDSAYQRTLIMAGTKEVLQTTRVTNDREAVSRLAAEDNHTYLKSPAGLFTEVRLPVEEIKNYTDANGNNHKEDSLLATKISFLRLNSMSSDDRMLGIPQNILMLQKDSLKSFFEKSKVPDSKTSFYTTYSSNYNTYTFTNISSLITALWNAREKGLMSDPAWVAHHPDWNKVLLVPVTFSVSSSTNVVTNMEHDMSLTSTQLVGGPNSDHGSIDVSVVYGKFKK